MPAIEGNMPKLAANLTGGSCLGGWCIESWRRSRGNMCSLRILGFSKSPVVITVAITIGIGWSGIESGG
ncbi:hypothetical protein KFK09_018261 [Dendrobium nobile]|uniref:Uncharacterized protein n=1 Tax=Dendrobium nobile TaxID=94219 RepID=A0A8T3AUD0_DENNO|nr:hypothetical protein KFK09_018261 [Dendrobium nobile]